MLAATQQEVMPFGDAMASDYGKASYVGTKAQSTSVGRTNEKKKYLALVR